MSLPIESVPGAAAAASVALVDALGAVLGDALVGMWLHGGTTFPDRPRHVGDLDICVVLSQASEAERDPRTWFGDPQARPSRVFAAQAAVANDHSVLFDSIYVLTDEMASGDPPSEAFNPDRPVLDWAIYRAHWLAGQYVLLYGRPPEEMVTAPTSAELRFALDQELEHLERHVSAGDAANPYEATYAVWNGCRILYTLATGSPVVSKRSAGAWGRRHLPERWHGAIAAAGRAYDGDATPADNELLSRTMAPFVEMVRSRLPV